MDDLKKDLLEDREQFEALINNSLIKEYFNTKVSKANIGDIGVYVGGILNMAWDIFIENNPGLDFLKKDLFKESAKELHETLTYYFMDC